MKQRIIDLSVTLQNGIPSDPPPFLPAIDYHNHAAGALQLAAMFPGLSPDDLPEKEGWAVEFVNMSTHAGTHMDAPWHYHSHMKDGGRSLTIDEIPLSWCIGPGVKLDFRHYPDGYVIGPEDLDKAFARIGHTLSAGDIVLINTAAGDRYGREDYLERGCGVGRSGTLYLTQKGVRLVGTDAWSWDAPFAYTRARYQQTGDASLIWEGHYAGNETPYCQIEKLSALDSLPDNGFTVISLPVKVHRASAGWCRTIALVDE